MKKKQNSGHWVLLIGIFIAIVPLLFVAQKIGITNNKNQFGNQKIDKDLSRRYSSKEMSISLDIPQKFIIKDTGITLLLLEQDKDISIIRNGTQFNNIHEYLSSSDDRLQTDIKEEKEANINSYPAVVRLESYNQEQETHKVYFLYVDSYVYIISTSSERLYDDLDQIARSFRYTP